MSPSILKSTTSICFALMLLQPGQVFAETNAPAPLIDGVPCLAGQKDCKPVPPKPHKVPTRKRAPDTANVRPLASAPQPPKQKPRAPVAPVTAPNVKPKAKAAPAPTPPVIEATPAPKLAPAPMRPDATPRPLLKPIPALKAPEVKPVPGVLPAPAAQTTPETKPVPAPKPSAVLPAPAAKLPDAQPAPEMKRVPAPAAPITQPKLEVGPAPSAKLPNAQLAPEAKSVPVPKALAMRPAPAAPAQAPAITTGTAKPQTAGRTGRLPPGPVILGTTTGGKPRPPVAAAAAPADAAIVPGAPPVKVGVRDVRRSDQNAPARDAPQIKRSASGLTDFEKFGLIALGAVAVGAILSNGQTVVSNTGDRVVVRDPNGQYGVMHDDNALVRRPGSTVSTRNYGDGSVLSRVVLANGTVVVTVLDANGRVLRRSVQYPNRPPVTLYDDTRPEITYNPGYRPRRSPVTILYTRDTSRAMLLRDFEMPPPQAYDRTFSLRQIRDVPEIRGLVPQADLSTLTFATGSSALTGDQAQTLAALGGAMADLITRNPAEVFLIEGHTDAVGDAGYNLALSDARAESVALALTEMFGVPPENMVTRGYGESDLALQTQEAAQVNRRVVVRRITPLLAAAD